MWRKGIIRLEGKSLANVFALGLAFTEDGSDQSCETFHKADIYLNWWQTINSSIIHMMWNMKQYYLIIVVISRVVFTHVQLHIAAQFWGLKKLLKIFENGKLLLLAKRQYFLLLLIMKFAIDQWISYWDNMVRKLLEFEWKFAKQCYLHLRTVSENANCKVRYTDPETFCLIRFRSWY